MSTAAHKIASIVRCIDRAREEYTIAGAAFRTSFTHQDAAVLNITRACEAAVDLASMLIRKKRIGIPADMKESLELKVPGSNYFYTIGDITARRANCPANDEACGPPAMGPEGPLMNSPTFPPPPRLLWCGHG